MSTSYFDFAFGFLGFLWQSFLVLAPMLLLGLLLGGLFHVFISRDAILRWFRGENLKAVAASAAIGVPMPLCSCSVVPVVAEMRRKGASRSSCMSFLITAPETGADSILVTNAFFGLPAAITRPAISFFTAVVAGLCCIGLIRDSDDVGETPNAEGNNRHNHSPCCDHGNSHHLPLFPDRLDCYISPVELKDEFLLWLKGTFRFNGRSPVTDNDQTSSGLKRIVSHIFRYGFVEIADDILVALLFGLVLGGLLYLLLPTELLTHEHARWASYPIMVLAGLPIYICASASTPIAAALVAKGLSPGAALVFLMTGPATNTGTIAIILSQFGGRFTSIYLGSVIAVTVMLGILVDLLILATGYSIIVNLEPSDSPTILLLQWIIGFVLIALIVWRFQAGAFRRGWQSLLVNIRPLVGR